MYDICLFQLLLSMIVAFLLSIVSILKLRDNFKLAYCCFPWEYEEVRTLLLICKESELTRESSFLQYCAKVMQAKSTNFVFCSPDFSAIVRAKIRAEIRGASSDNSLKQSAIFRRTFITSTTIRDQ